MILISHLLSPRLYIQSVRVLERLEFLILELPLQICRMTQLVCILLGKYKKSGKDEKNLK